jgi:hypothetical protein
MDTLKNNFDSLEQLIYSEGVKIKAVDIHKDLDILLVILNTGFVLKEKLSNYFQLSQATNSQLLNFQLIGNGAGIHWPDLDEDLSLKGFLRNNLKSLVVGEKVA